MRKIIFFTALCIVAIGFVENVPGLKIPFKKSASNQKSKDPARPNVSVDSDKSESSNQSNKPEKSKSSNDRLKELDKSESSNQSNKPKKSKSSNDRLKELDKSESSHLSKIPEKSSMLSKLLPRSLAGRFNADLSREKSSDVLNDTKEEPSQPPSFVIPSQQPSLSSRTSSRRSIMGFDGSIMGRDGSISSSSRRSTGSSSFKPDTKDLPSSFGSLSLDRDLRRTQSTPLPVTSQTKRERINRSAIHHSKPLPPLPETSPWIPPHDVSQTTLFSHPPPRTLNRRSIGSSDSSVGSSSRRSTFSRSSSCSVRSTDSTTSEKTRYSILSEPTESIKSVKSSKRFKLGSNSTNSQTSMVTYPGLRRSDSVKSFTQPYFASTDSRNSTKSQHATSEYYSPYRNELGASKSKHGSFSSKSAESRLPMAASSGRHPKPYESFRSNSSASTTSSFYYKKPRLELEHVIMTIRHGQRTSFTHVPIFVRTAEQLKDIYGNEQFGGILTPKGHLSMFGLGELFRKRYGDFLTPHNVADPSADIRVASTGVERSRLSAKAFVNGLYHPHGEKVTNYIPNTDVDPGSIPWCERLKREQRMIFKTMGTELDDPLTDWLISNLGEETVEQYSLFDIVDNIFAEAGGGFKHPEWVDMEKLKKWKFEKFALNTASETAIRLKAGPMLKHILGEFSKIIKSGTRRSKMSVFGSHDDSVQAIVTSLNVKMMDAQTYLDTDYGCAVIFELYSSRDPDTDVRSFYVQVLYSKNTKMEMAILEINGCSQQMCPIQEFAQLLNARGVIPFYWKEECEMRK